MSHSSTPRTAASPRDRARRPQLLSRGPGRAHQRRRCGRRSRRGAGPPAGQGGRRQQRGVAALDPHQEVPTRVSSTGRRRMLTSARPSASPAVGVFDCTNTSAEPGWAVDQCCCTEVVCLPKAAQAKPIRRSAPASWAVRRIAASSSTTLRAWTTTRAPTSVSATSRVVRCSTRAPRARSRAATVREIDACEVCSSAAAPVRCRRRPPRAGPGGAAPRHPYVQRIAGPAIGISPGVGACEYSGRWTARGTGHCAASR